MYRTLKKWLEPVTPVQSISESGITTVPDRYVKPPPDRPAAADTLSYADDTWTHNIPTVDLAASATSAAAAVSAACREWGFFQVVNHGVGEGRMRGVRDAWGEFFRLPAELKRSYANAPTTYEGYGSRLGTEVGAELDWGDYFFLNLLPESAKDYAKWPTEPPNCREITEEYGREVVKLCGALLRLLSISLGLGADFLERSFGGAEEVGAACLRVSYYPKCPQPELTLGLSAHSDPGGLTVLSADDRVLGLQVRKAGRWITVRPLPGALIVNVGDQIQVITNGIYKSVEHRVVVNAVAERLSIAVFYNPRNDLLIGPAPELLTPEQPPLYRPMTYGEYRMFIRKNGPKGKVQVESLKTV
ncbi:Leucoanthocyanidin dioxygenase [Ananas comosus]|uniref:Leucoanthocyanidin dioxygenase n=1 Tax=Ananas comosus TaxID=4615 RepID=A0A199W1Z1_ANACO|nr:Leucoanthocyanidin dioxygenase [Ananas comosus]